MRLTRRQLLATAALAGVLPAGIARAGGFPEKPVTVIVPFPPGGRTDLTARLLTQHMLKHVGNSVVIVNKPGAGGAIGAREVAASAPDGYTLGVFSTAAVTAQYTLATPVNLKDFVAIRTINLDPMALAVKADAPWKTLRELVDYGVQNPGKLRVGMIPGASAEIFAAAFANAAKLKVLYVPFKGDSDGAVALAGGHIDVHVAVPASYKALADANKVRMLGIAAEQRSPLYEGVPTFVENGVDLVIGSFHMLFAPRRTPPEILRALEEAAGKAMREPDLIRQMEAANLGYANMDVKQTDAFLRQQDAVYRKVIEDAGLRVAPREVGSAGAPAR
jgi:tripartite-type tricarboxylate transporter receptor subunit TctC